MSLVKLKFLFWKIISCLGRKLFPLKKYNKGFVQNRLNHMSVTKKLLFRLVSRSEVRRFGLVELFNLNQLNLIGKVLKMWISKEVWDWKNYFHYLFVHKNNETYIMFKKIGTATLSLRLNP